MFEFRWDLPGLAHTHELRLQIRSRSGWIGRKVLFLDGRQVYRRRWFSGIDHNLAHPEDPRRLLELRAVEVPSTGRWVPQLRCDGCVVPEVTGASPPPVPDRPKVVAIVVGSTYLAIFMMVVMLQHIPNMLEAVRAHSDVRTYALEVVGPGLEEAGLRLLRTPPPRATLNQPYEATFAAEGGTPPYRWDQVEGRLPRGLTFDQADATIRGTPTTAGGRTLSLQVTDAAGAQARGRYAISVHAAKPGFPVIETEALPVAKVGQPYAVQLDVAGGQPPYRWTVNDRGLPRGLKFAADKGTAGDDASRPALAGTPAADVAGTYTLELRVSDSSYSPRSDIEPWFVPFGVTSVGLLGFWNMRRWSVPVFGGLIVVQAALGLAGAGWYPFSVTSVVLQGLVWSVGAAYLGRMH